MQHLCKSKYISYPNRMKYLISLRVWTEYPHPVGNSQGILKALGPRSSYVLISAVFSQPGRVTVRDLPRQCGPGSVPCTSDLDRMRDWLTSGILLNSFSARKIYKWNQKANSKHPDHYPKDLTI